MTPENPEQDDSRDTADAIRMGFAFAAMLVVVAAVHDAYRGLVAVIRKPR